MYRPKLADFASPLIALLLAFSITQTLVPSTSAAAERRGVPITGNMGITQTTKELMEIERRNPGPREPILHDEHEFEREDLPVNPASPRVASIPRRPIDQLTGYRRDKGLGMEILAPQTIGVNFTAATLGGVNPTNAFPPDCDGSIGPTQYVVGVNGRIVSFNKTTGLADGVLSLSTDNFFNSIRNFSGTSDPQVRYDRLSGRWFLMIINVASQSNRVLIGVSDAASAGVISPTTVWTFFWFVAAAVPPSISPNCFADYPSLGVDANALYIGTDNFCPTFNSTDGFVVRKSSILGAGPIVVTAFRGLMTAAGGFVGPFAPRGVDNVDPNSNEGYFIGVDGNSFGTLDMHRISDPGGTPSISANIPITIPATSNPLSVPHLGNTVPATGNIDALDDRVFYAQIRNQQLWVAQNIAVDATGVVGAPNTRNATRWHQFDVQVGSGTPTIVQSGTVFDPAATNPRFYNVPSIVVSGQGHAALSMTTGGAAERLNAATVGRLVDDPLGTMQTPVLVTASGTAYNPPNDTGAGRGRRRWGDYSVMQVDPLDDQTMWAVNMFCNATNSYGVQVTKLIAPGPATPSALPDVAAGYPAVNVTLTGLPTGGTGFFDPGPNLPGVPAYNHLQATISAGAATGTPPTVVSATYVNPTTVNLVLNTTAATPNVGSEMYTIDIANPDGQTSSAAIVHVVAGTQYTIDASAGAGGSISPSGSVSVLSGNDQTFTITADHCYSIADVLVDGGSVGPVASHTFTNVTANHTIAASFTLLGPYTITASTTDANGAISDPGPSSVACGDSKTYTITPNACYHVNDVKVDGISVGAVLTYTFSDVTANHTIEASFDVNSEIGPVTAISAAQVKSGNDASGTTRIAITYTGPSGATSIEVWRKAYGDYPLYAGGSVPVVPISYPPAGWDLTSVAASGGTDQPPTRGFWYYIAYAKDACNTVSHVSPMTNGTLDYHLGDVSDGFVPGQGDNVVNTADASLLGAHYGVSGGALSGFEYLDVGPTTDFSTDGRPTPDGKTDIEDLVLFALNYTPAVSSPKMLAATPSTGHDEVSLSAPLVVNQGEVVEIPLELKAGGGLRALSVAMSWDAAVVAPVDVMPGTYVAEQEALLLSPGAGKADVAVLGAQRTLNGTGVFATMKFRALASGDPNFGIQRVIGRNRDNRDLPVTSRNPLIDDSPVTQTEFAIPVPNPSQGMTVLQYALSARGPVKLAVYSVDGRRVKTLARGVQEAGRYRVTWNGTDDRGTVLNSGVYFARFEAGVTQATRLISIVK